MPAVKKNIARPWRTAARRGGGGDDSAGSLERSAAPSYYDAWGCPGCDGAGAFGAMAGIASNLGAASAAGRAWQKSLKASFNTFANPRFLS